MNEKLFSVQPNCLYALRQLQSNVVTTEWYWIDAICINQQDDIEKVAQVQSMVQIYRNASLVAASIGPGSARTDYILANLAQIATQASLLFETDEILRGDGIPLSEIKELTGAEDRAYTVTCYAHYENYICNALIELAESAYWHRLWVVQELANAKSRTLLLRTRSTI